MPSNDNHVYGNDGSYSPHNAFETTFQIAGSQAGIRLWDDGGPTNPSTGYHIHNYTIRQNATGVVIYDTDTVSMTRNLNVRHPTHTYGAAGTFTVTLTITGLGVSDTVVKPDYICVSRATIYLPLVLRNG